MPFSISQTVTGVLASTMLGDATTPNEQVVYPQPSSSYCYQVPMQQKNIFGFTVGYEYQTYCYEYPQTNSYTIIYETHR